VQQSLTLGGQTGRRALSFSFGVGMIVSSIMTVRHYFAANFPESIFEGSFCDINAFFNCDASAYAVISQIGGVPLGYFGMSVGLLVVMGAVFPSLEVERTNKTIALVNVIGVVALLLYSVSYMRSLCLLCAGFYLFSIANFVLFWRYGIDRDQPGLFARYFQPSARHALAFGTVMLGGAYGFAEYHEAREEAQSGSVAARVVEEFYSLPTVEWPSFISPYWTMRSTENFEDAPIRIVEYVDLLCPDCLYLAEQMERAAQDFHGKINLAYQLFPLEAACNDVVEKDLHPGACDVSYMAAYDPDKFHDIQEDIWANFRAARTPEGREELARKYQVDAALTDSATIHLVRRMIETGREYEKTSEEYSHGIRSTPTMIVNNRMIIGTFPYEQLKAIFQALVDEHEGGGRFMENWVEE
jgi:uncharacterized membrane protein